MKNVLKNPLFLVGLFGFAAATLASHLGLSGGLTDFVQGMGAGLALVGVADSLFDIRGGMKRKQTGTDE